MRHLCFCLLLLSVACATTKKYEAMLDTWKGDNVDNLVMKWGAPAKTFTMPNGMTVYEYLFNGGSYATTNVYNNIAYTDVSNSWCKTSFFTQNSKVVNWRWEGNACKSK